MKTILLLSLFSLALGLSAMAGAEATPGDNTGKSEVKNTSSCGNLIINFSNKGNADFHSDSVLVIFDKFNHTAAGFIKKVFYVNQNNAIDISEIPAGRYFVSIQCLGLHRDYVERVFRIVKHKRKKVKIKLQDCEEFVKEKVRIPEQEFDFGSLSITKIK